MPAPTLEALFAALPQSLPVPPYRIVAPAEIPEPFKKLLVHNSHMTVAMEKHHQCKIGVKVLQSQNKDDWYARQILLLPVGTERVVQGGIVRIHLDMLDPEVQAAILREDTPLGHVLIHHEVLRHIEVTSYVRFDELPNWPGFPPHTPAYGRLGILYCDLRPAIELFEVVPSAQLDHETVPRL